MRQQVERSVIGHDRRSDAVDAGTAGPLTVHPENPCYFADASGKAVYLTGSHTWATIQELGPALPIEKFDWGAFLDLLTEHGHSFTRLWSWEHPKWGSWWPSDYFIDPVPWARTGPGLAQDGLPKFDLTRFDERFFERLRMRTTDVRNRGIYASVMLFNGWSSCNKPFQPQGPNPWLSHPFHPDNNVNGVDGSGPDQERNDWFHTLRSPEVVRLSETYVMKTIDTVNDLDNVIYEIANETEGSDESIAWQYHLINFIHRYEREQKQHQHPVLITGFYPGQSNAALFASPAEAVSPSGWHGEGTDNWETDPPPGPLGKVILPDPDHIWGVGGDADWVWRTFTRGHNVIYMDPWGYGHMEPRYREDGDDQVRRAMGQTRAVADRVDLARTMPAPELASTRFVLADPGVEYVVYQPYLGRFTVDLRSAPGTFDVTWFDPIEGSSSGGAVAGGAVVRFVAPDEASSVLHLNLARQEAPAARPVTRRRGVNWAPASFELPN